MDRFYKLNIRSKGVIFVWSGNINICYDGLDYIMSCKSLKQAYEKCNNAEWLSNLVDSIFIDKYDYILSLDEYIEEKEDVYLLKHNLDISEISDEKIEQLEKLWNRLYCKYIKKYIPWKMLKYRLLKNNIIVRR